ncbi:MAG: hypothetical protein ACRELG_29000 [Gemmataceae bacterium]
MRFLRRIMGAMVLLLSAAGIVCCLAGIVAIRMFHQSASEKVNKITARLDDGLQRASVASQNVQRALEQARASVDKVSKESAALGGSEAKNHRATSAVRKVIRQQVGPNINDLGVRLATLSDAATAVSSLLQSFQELSPGQTGRIQPDKLEGWTDQAAQLSTTLRRLEVVAGDGNKESSGREVAAASRAVGLALQRCQAKVDHWHPQLESARQELQHARTEILRWLTPAMIAVTFMFAWAAVGQVCLFGHALHWLRGT